MDYLNELGHEFFIQMRTWNYNIESWLDKYSYAVGLISIAFIVVMFLVAVCLVIHEKRREDEG